MFLNIPVMYFQFTFDIPLPFNVPFHTTQLYLKYTCSIPSTYLENAVKKPVKIREIYLESTCSYAFNMPSYTLFNIPFIIRYMICSVPWMYVCIYRYTQMHIVFSISYAFYIHRFIYFHYTVKSYMRLPWTQV